MQQAFAQLIRPRLALMPLRAEAPPWPSALSASAAFEGATDEALWASLPHWREACHPPGEAVLRAGGRITSLMVVRHGRVYRHHAGPTVSQRAAPECVAPERAGLSAEAAAAGEGSAGSKGPAADAAANESGASSASHPALAEPQSPRCGGEPGGSKAADSGAVPACLMGAAETPASLGRGACLALHELWTGE